MPEPGAHGAVQCSGRKIRRGRVKDAKSHNLGENHKRAIGTVMFLLDQMLCDFEAFAKGRELHGLLYHERNRLSAKQRRAIRNEIGHIREIMKELTEMFGLEPRVEDVSREIWGRSSMFWEDLVETETKYLRRYGAMPPGLENHLDPKIESLIERLNNISRIAGGKPSGHAPCPEEPPDEP